MAQSYNGAFMPMDEAKNESKGFAFVELRTVHTTLLFGQFTLFFSDGSHSILHNSYSS